MSNLDDVRNCYLFSKLGLLYVGQLMVRGRLRAREVAPSVSSSELQALMSRVNGTLAVARAMGDFSFKREKKMSAEEQQVTCDPEIRKFGMERNDEFLILACDGIWDVMTSQEAVDFVGGKIKEGKELKQILSDLFDNCLSPHPSANEVSVSSKKRAFSRVLLRAHALVLQWATMIASCLLARMCGIVLMGACELSSGFFVRRVWDVTT